MVGYRQFIEPEHTSCPASQATQQGPKGFGSSDKGFYLDFFLPRAGVQLERTFVPLKIGTRTATSRAFPRPRT